VVPPFIGEAVKVTLFPVQIVPDGEAEIETLAVTLELTVIVIGALVAVDEVVHAALLVIITLTWSLFTSVVVVNVEAVCPATGVPFICHSYVGAVPPLTGVAVNVTLDPSHTVVWLVMIDTEGVTLEIFIVIGELEAVAEVTQVALDVSSTVTISPFARDEEVNVGMLVPVFDPLTFHWKAGVVPPLTGVAVNVTDVPEQIAPEGDAITETEGVILVITSIVTGLLAAVGDVVQFALEVNVTLTWSVLASVFDVKVDPFSPRTVMPFNCQRYVGDIPPLVGFAVKVTGIPEQIVPVGDTDKFTDGVILGLTVIVNGLLEAVAVVTQLALLVIVTTTWSLFARLAVVNVEAVCPETGVPFICHS
jgi:hypothetical protein